MSTRHRRQSWQKTGSEAACGVLIGADAMWTIHSHDGLVHLSTLALGVLSAGLIVGTGTWVVSIAWHKGRHRYLVHNIAYTPLRRPLYPVAATDEDTPAAEVALHYATRADYWRNEIPGGLDAITGPRPYMPPDPAEAEELVR